MSAPVTSSTEAATSYAAALASGSATKPAAAAAPAPPKPSATPMPSTNGVAEPSTGSSTPRSVTSDARSKQSSAASSTRPTIASTGRAKSDDDSVTTTDDKSSGWEGNSQASSQPESKSSGAETARFSDLVLQPAANPWKTRQDQNAAKARSLPSVTSAPSAAVNVSAPTAPVKVQNVGKKGGDADKEQKKANEEGPAKRGTRRARSQEGDAPVSLPPPVTDTNSWPTPDLAQGEFKKEKDNKEKDKTVPLAGRGSSKTWVPVAIDPPYAPPIQSKAGRGGRGGRGGRESGRGGATGAPHGGERQERVAGQNALGTPEGDRGRQYSNPRGGGYKAPKRSSSGGAGTRRETKNGSGERKKDVGEWNSESSAPLASAQARPAKSGEDGASIGDAHHYPEGEEKVMNGNGYRPEKSSNWVPRNEADSSGAYNPRGSDRGRGGYRGRGNYGNGHHIPGHPNNMPYPQGVNNHPFNHHTQLRGGSFRGRGGGYGYNQHYRVNPNMIPQFTHPIYAPGYEYSMIPGGAQPVDFGALIHQMNYYFSVDNLCKDMYLRKHMDSDGFVKLSFLMGFQRVQLHTKDIGVLRDVCLESPEITLAFGQDDYYVRRKDGWENWVLKEEDRHESARRDQRDWHIDPRQRKHIGAALTPPGEMSASAEPFFPGSGNMAPIYYSHANPPYGYPGPMSSLSATVPEFSPSPHNTLAPFNESVPPFTPDDFSDADIDLLMLVSKRLGTGDNSPVPQETSPHRPNGADAASIGERLQSTVLGNGDGVYDDSGRSSRSNGDVSHYARKSQPDDIDWFKTGYNEETNMITHRSYSEVRAQALKQREAGSVGKNNDLMTLYKFWSHFLVGKFNASIYQEFKTLALRDADQGQRSGVEYLFMVYERSLKIRGVVGYEVINDFIELVKLDASHGESLGVDKLRRLLANPELKEEFRAAVESLIDNDLHGIMSNGVGKKNSRSPAAEPYSASKMVACA